MTPLLALAALTVKLSAYACQAPCDIWAEVIIARHPDNRAFVIQVDGPTFQGHAVTLEGEKAAVIQPPVWFKHLEPGTYELVVVLYRLGSNAVARERRTIEVR